MSLKDTPATQSILILIIFTVPAYEESKKKNNLQFMILTYQWAWNKVKAIKPGINCQTPSRIMIMQSLKYLP